MANICSHVKHADDIRAAAIALRLEGRSLREIAVELGIALSTASRWVRSVPTQSGAAEVVQSEPVAPSGSRRTTGRRCGRCGLVKSQTAFARHEDGAQWWCRECFATYQAGRRAANQELARRRRARAAAFVQRALTGRSCVDCGASDVVVLEFDHVRGEKRLEISKLINRAASDATLAAEVAKCDVVCVNCHRRRTHSRAGGPKRPRMPHEIRGEELLRNKLEAGCVDCGELDRMVLDLDHQGVKRGKVPRLIRDGYSAKVIADELASCEVRCANCHRRRTTATSGFSRGTWRSVFTNS